MVNTKIRLIIFFAAKDGEALYSQQKQDQELTVAQIMNSTFQVPSSAWQMLETRRRETTDMLKTQSRVSSHAATSLPAARGTRGDWTRLVAAVAPGPPGPGPGQL